MSEMGRELPIRRPTTMRRNIALRQTGNGHKLPIESSGLSDWLNLEAVIQTSSGLFVCTASQGQMRRIFIGT